MYGVHCHIYLASYKHCVVCNNLVCVCGIWLAIGHFGFGCVASSQYSQPRCMVVGFSSGGRSLPALEFWSK